MAALRILHLSAPGKVGGLESVVQSLATGHAARGHQVAVFASMSDDSQDHPFTQALREGGVTVHAPRLAGRGYWQERQAIRACIGQLRPHLVHSHGYRADVVGLAAAAGLPSRRVTTVHGFTGGDWKNRLYERIQLRAFRRFDGVVPVSRPLMDRIVTSGVPPSRVHLIPNAIASRRAGLERAAARAALELPQDDFLIGWVGRISQEKALDVMLDALQSLADLPVRLIVVGDGRERSVLQQRIVGGPIERQVTWLGVVPEASRYFSAFDLFVLSSHTEGTPITILEAMQAGVPIVTTRVGGIPDVVSPDEAWLVPSGDPPALANAIREAWSHPEACRQRSAAASQRVARQFAVGPWLDCYESLYQSLLDTRSTS